MKENGRKEKMWLVHLKTKGLVPGGQRHSVPSLSPTQAQCQPEPRQQEHHWEINAASEVWTKQTAEKAAQCPSIRSRSTGPRSSQPFPSLVSSHVESGPGEIQVFPHRVTAPNEMVVWCALSFSLSLPLSLPLPLPLPASPPPLLPVSLSFPLPFFSLSSPLLSLSCNNCD